MKIVCYKAVFRPQSDYSYDVPFTPECEPEQDVEYVMFTKTPAAFEHAGWQIRPAVFAAKGDRRRARMHKALPHVLFPTADFTLWLDGNLTPITSPRSLVGEYASAPDVHVVSHRHPARSCLYEEAEVVIRQGEDDPEIVAAQVERYRQEGYPANFGLAETGALLRRNSFDVRAFNELWQREIEHGSRRDQVSFDYCRWKLGLRPLYFRGVSKNSPHFRHRGHRFARENPEFRWSPAGPSRSTGGR